MDIPDLVSQLFGTLDGNLEPEIAAVENRLGIRLPPVLRDTYARAGRLPRLWDARARGCWHLRGLGGIRVESDLLVFAEEQQGCFEWAVECAPSTDLTVFEGGDGDWTATPESLDSFLRGLVLFHVSSAMLEWEMGDEVPRERLQTFLDGWEHIAFRPLCTALDFYVRGSVVLRCDWCPNSAVVFAGGREPDELAAVARSLGISLPEPWPEDVC